MRRTAKFPVTVIALLLLAAACGSDDEAVSTTTTSDATRSETAADSSAESADPRDQAEYVILNADGVSTERGAASFGDDEERVLELVSPLWGEPIEDSGTQPTGPDCVVDGDTFRQIRWDDRMLLFVDGTLDYWISGAADQAIEIFVGDTTTIPVRSGQTTLAELKAQVADHLTVTDESPVGPQFAVDDNFGTLRGGLSDTSDAGVVQYGEAGSAGCVDS